MMRGDGIETVPHWEVVWWDKDSDREYIGAVTGTPWKPLPGLEQRKVERMYGKPVHKACGGILRVPKNETGICTDPSTYEVECLKCGKRLIAYA
jgi:hypothetical protein